MKYWVVPQRKSKSQPITSYDVVAYSPEGTLSVIRRHPVNRSQTRKIAEERAEYDKRYFDANGIEGGVTWSERTKIGE